MASHDLDDDKLDDFTLAEYHFKNQLSPEYKAFNDFLDSTKYIVEKKGQEKNIWEQGGSMRCFNFPNDIIPKFFSLYEKCRLSGIIMHFTEKQEKESSGIRYDLDIYQGDKNKKTLLLSDLPFNKFANKFAKIFAKIFDLPKKEINVLVVVETKPKVIYDEKMKQYKDGVHINIPSLKISRKAKRYLLHQILEQKIMTDCFGNDYKGIADPEDFLDKQSCHVPLLLFGSVKSGVKQAYNYKVSYLINYDSNGQPTIIQNGNFTPDKYNMSLEISSSFDGEHIEKIHIEPKEQYINEVDAWETRNRVLNITEDQLEETINDMNHLTVNDPDARYVKDLLDILKPFRYNNYNAWFNVISALVSNGDRYIPLAKWFSQKSEKYNSDDDFDKAVDSAKHNIKKHGFTINHIYWWAQKDNPDKFDKINYTSCFHKLLQMVRDKINEGKLGHANFAELALICVKNKYITDYRGSNKQRVWYEFKFPEDKMKLGQVYKWVEVNHPDALDRYLSSKLHIMNLKMVDWLQKIMTNAPNKEAVMYHKTVLRNFKSCCRCLFQDNFKTSVLRQMEKMLVVPGFIDSLDKDDMALGVAQGVLMLSQFGYKPKLIKSFHSIKISRYTSTSYVEFDPKDPITRKLLRAYRSMFPDDETDAFEYHMIAHAASIDYRPRDALAFLGTGGGGNGKSAFEEMHAAALGEQYCTSQPIAMILENGKDGNGESPSSFYMKLEAARSAYYEEGPSLATLNMPVIKRITGCATLTGRDLNERARNFESRCIHFVLSNHDFQIRTFEEATMRRLRYILYKITFKDEVEFDPDNASHRLKDPSFDANMRNNPEYRSRYLSIMTFFHMKLMHYHSGRIDNVPHETIDRDTLEFRNRQDHLNRFLTTRVVKRVPLPADSTDKYEMTSLEGVCDEYVNWYEKNVKTGGRHFKQDIMKQILDSVLKDHIEITRHGNYLKAEYRVLPTGEMPDTGEVFLHQVDKKGKQKKYSFKFKKETPDQSLDRFEKEWKELCTLDTNKTKIDVNMSDAFEGASDDEDSRQANYPKKKTISKDDYEIEEDDVTRAIEKDIHKRKVDEMGFTDSEYSNSSYSSSDEESDSDSESSIKKPSKTKKSTKKTTKKLIKKSVKKSVKKPTKKHTKTETIQEKINRLLSEDITISSNETVSEKSIKEMDKYIKNLNW
jgi:phage/plasmid-associated DNA primase